MLWDLFGEEAGKVYRSWNTAVKLDWGLPRTNHTYLVDHLLGLGMPSVRQRLLCQYVGYVRKMFKSSSKEVRVLSQILARNAQSVTGKNLLHIQLEFHYDPWIHPLGQFKSMDIRRAIPTSDKWRPRSFDQLLAQRWELDICGEELEEVSSLIDSLSST